MPQALDSWEGGCRLCFSQLASRSVETPPYNQTEARVIKVPVFSASSPGGEPPPSEQGLGIEKGVPKFIAAGTRNLTSTTQNWKEYEMLAAYLSW